MREERELDRKLDVLLCERHLELLREKEREFLLLSACVLTNNHQFSCVEIFMSVKSTTKMTKIITPQKLPKIQCHKDRKRECQEEREGDI